VCTYVSGEEEDQLWDACEQDTHLRAHIEYPERGFAGADRDV